MFSAATAFSAAAAGAAASAAAAAVVGVGRGHGGGDDGGRELFNRGNLFDVKQHFIFQWRCFPVYFKDYDLVHQ